MRLWILLAVAVAAYDLHYVNHTETITPLGLPPANRNGAFEYIDRKVRATAMGDYQPGFQVQLYLTDFCFTGEFLNSTAPKAKVYGMYYNNSLTLDVRQANTTYWCLNTSLDPDVYKVMVDGIQWWESVTITFPVPAPENAISSDVFVRDYYFISGTDPAIDYTYLSIPDGSNTTIGETQGTGWITPDPSLTLMAPEGAAFLILKASTAPGDSIHWMAMTAYNFTSDPPWFPEGRETQTMFHKANSVVDTYHAAVIMTPLNPSNRTNLTLSYAGMGTHNITGVSFYFVNVDSSRRISSAGGTSTYSADERGAIAGGVVGGALTLIVGAFVYWRRSKRLQARRDFESDKFVIEEDNEPSLVPTPLGLPPPSRPIADLPAGAEPPQVTLGLLKHVPGSVEPQRLVVTPEAAPVLEVPRVFLKDTAEFLEPRPFSKTPATASVLRTGPSGSAQAPSPPVSSPLPSPGTTQPPPLPGPRFRNDVDAGLLQRVANSDAASDSGTVLVPPTYDPRWRYSQASGRSRDFAASEEPGTTPERGE